MDVLSNGKLIFSGSYNSCGYIFSKSITAPTIIDIDPCDANNPCQNSICSGPINVLLL